MTLVFLDMAAPFGRFGLPVSGSTSTSQNWVAKPGAAALGFTAAAATIALAWRQSQFLAHNVVGP
jgi:hypothetical protein